MQGLKLLLDSRVEDAGSLQAVKGGLGGIKTTFDPDEVTIRVKDSRFLGQTHDGLEEVVVAAHQVIELVEEIGLLNGIQAVVAKISPDQACVFLLDEAVIILVPGPAAGQVDTGDLLTPEADQVMVEKFAAVVRVNFPDREG